MKELLQFVQGKNLRKGEIKNDITGNGKKF